MINSKLLQEFDLSKMYETYDKWHTIAHDSYNSSIPLAFFKDVDHIIFSGMGGSGAMGDLFKSIIPQDSIQVSVVKGFHLPQNITSNSLVIATSVSGNTSETISTLNDAFDFGCNVIGFSSGGLMEQICLTKHIPYRKIPLHHSPRASFPSYVYSIIHILNSIFKIKSSDISESLLELTNMQKIINSSNLTEKNTSLKLATWLSDMLMIYFPFGLQPAAIRFKNSLQENTKSHAFAEDIMESCHNGIVSWESPSSIKPLFIEGKDDYIKTKQLWTVIHTYFDKNNIDYRKISTINGNILSKLVCLIYLFDYATLYRSIILKRDPTPVQSIDFIKSEMKKFNQSNNI